MVFFLLPESKQQLILFGIYCRQVQCSKMLYFLSIKEQGVYKWNYEFANILLKHKSIEWWVIRINYAVWSGSDPRSVISVHIKSGLVTNLVPSHFISAQWHNDFRGTALCVVCRGNAPVEDVVSLRRTREHTGVVVITTSNIYFFRRKYDCVIFSCSWVEKSMVPMEYCFGNSKKNNRTFGCCKKIKSYV